MSSSIATAAPDLPTTTTATDHHAMIDHLSLGHIAGIIAGGVIAVIFIIAVTATATTTALKHRSSNRAASSGKEVVYESLDHLTSEMEFSDGLNVSSNQSYGVHIDHV